MATTKEKTLTAAWVKQAEGAGVVVMTKTPGGDDDADWVITDSDTTPAFTNGHSIESRENLSVELLTGERLWVIGDGKLMMTGTNVL